MKTFFLASLILCLTLTACTKTSETVPPDLSPTPTFDIENNDEELRLLISTYLTLKQDLWDKLEPDSAFYDTEGYKNLLDLCIGAEFEGKLYTVFRMKQELLKVKEPKVLEPSSSKITVRAMMVNALDAYAPDILNEQTYQNKEDGSTITTMHRVSLINTVEGWKISDENPRDGEQNIFYELYDSLAAKGPKHLILNNLDDYILNDFIENHLENIIEDHYR